MSLKVAIGSDHGGLDLKIFLVEVLKKAGVDVTDVGVSEPGSVDYPDYALKVTDMVRTGMVDLGVLLCGTGIGMCITANKVPGAYAALCSDAYSTERSIKSNNANIMTMGSQVTGSELAKSLVKIWMASEYVPGGRSQPKIQRIYDYAKDSTHKG